MFACVPARRCTQVMKTHAADVFSQEICSSALTLAAALSTPPQREFPGDDERCRSGAFTSYIKVKAYGCVCMCV